MYQPSQPVRANSAANLHKDRHPRQLWKISRVDSSALFSALLGDNKKSTKSSLTNSWFSLSPPLQRWSAVQAEKLEAARETQGLDLAGNLLQPRDVAEMSSQQIDHLLLVSDSPIKSAIHLTLVCPNYEAAKPRFPSITSTPVVGYGNSFT